MLKVLISAASLVLAAHGTAIAQQKVPDVTISYRDLDLTNPADVRVLDRRIGWAIMSVCTDDRGPGGPMVVPACKLAKQAELAPLRAKALAAATTRSNAAVAAR